jgi:hypothetical protein
MGRAPLHPDEPQLHHELRDALNERLVNTSFFVWIDVTPTGDSTRFEELDRIVSNVEWWLGTLDPDATVAAEQVRLFDRAAEVKVRAVPKKPGARSHRAEQIVGNPEPVLVGWS